MVDSLEKGLDLDNPIVILFRKVNLEAIAKRENSDLFCPTCNTNLPYNPMTVAQKPAGTDADFNPLYEITYFCTLCQEYFDKK